MYEDTLDRSDLLFKLKLLKDKVAAFETGEKYIRMKNEFKIVRESDLRYIRSLELEIEQLHSEIHRVRDIWYDTCEDIYKEHEKEINALKKDYERVLKDKDREIASLRKELLKADIRNENNHSKQQRKDWQNSGSTSRTRTPWKKRPESNKSYKNTNAG